MKRYYINQLKGMYNKKLKKNRKESFIVKFFKRIFVGELV